jgi:MoaA/NifB/PqqE/SkfB family radical SAM enzyme
VSLNFQATRFRCSWPWETAVLLCDGRVVCGCADPYGARVLGDARTTPVGAIWTGDTASALRRDLNAGGSTFCGDCPLKLPLADDEPARIQPLHVGDGGVTPLPRRLYVETTAACNISCLDACCAPETGITKTRQAGMLDPALFARVLDELGPTLARLDFFNYGEAFLHKKAVEMCELVKSRFPHVYLYTSTNGGAFTEERVRQLVRSGIDEMTFSLDGASQDVYVRYRQRGSFEKATAMLRAAIDEKRRLGRDVPVINWRYILFTWNDSDREMQRARRLAAEWGVDRLCWEITDHPEDAYSRRFAPGSEAHAAIRREIWDDNNLGNAIAGAMPRARIEVRTDGTPDAPLVAAPGRTIHVSTRVRNLSQRPFAATATYGRRHVRLGAQLAGPDGTPIDRDWARAFLPRTIEGGQRADVGIDVPAPSEPGRYALRFDLVSEGIDWFETCGSEPTVRELVVTSPVR